MESLAVLESFVRSAEVGSFSEAARRLGLTPAAVSKNVAKLEASLGLRLFQRTTRSLRVTEQGARLLGDLATGVTSIREALANAAGAAAEPAGSLRVSLSPTFGRDYIVPVLRAFLDRHPRVSLDWRFDNRQVDLVAEGFDVAIGAAIELSSGVVARELARAHIIAVASPEYLAARGVPTRPPELEAHDGIVLRSPQSGRIRSWPFRTLKGDEASFDLRPRIVFDDTEAIAQAALLGLGIGIVSMPHALTHLRSGALVRVLPKWHADAGPISLYFAGQKHVPGKTRAFVDHVVTWFRRERLAKRLSAS